MQKICHDILCCKSDQLHFLLDIFSVSRLELVLLAENRFWGQECGFFGKKLRRGEIFCQKLGLLGALLATTFCRKTLAAISPCYNHNLTGRNGRNVIQYWVSFSLKFC